jgi:hypothetical protein
MLFELFGIQIQLSPISAILLGFSIDFIKDNYVPWAIGIFFGAMINAKQKSYKDSDTFDVKRLKLIANLVIFVGAGAFFIPLISSAIMYFSKIDVTYAVYISSLLIYSTMYLVFGVRNERSN